MNVISYNARKLNPPEQKLSTLDRELLRKVQALQIFEILIIGSPYTIHQFTDHKPLLHYFTKRKPCPTFLSCSSAIHKLSKLKSIHTPGRILSVARYAQSLFYKN